MTLYQPFLDYAIALLSEKLSLTPYPIPAGFERKEELSGKGKNRRQLLPLATLIKLPNCDKFVRLMFKGEMLYKFLILSFFPI